MSTSQLFNGKHERRNQIYNWFCSMEYKFRECAEAMIDKLKVS